MDNCAYALSLASRVYMRWELYGWIGPEGLDDERNDIEGSESTPSSRFNKLPRIELIHLVTEPIRFHSYFKFNVQNALRIDYSSSESILKRRILNREPRSRGACEANNSAYDNSGPSGVVSAVGSLFPRGTKANVVVYGSGRGPPANVPATNLGPGSMVLRGSTNDGYPVLVLDRSGLAMITDRVSSP
ncbi:hypothetical protein PIB30_068646 [Stylosanthes scabra]|uniref:Uncharacterized protein n=1 Tax=Stylosanthes scabra TaxID=79078 RepID=A0ABU6XKS5_9FABA|nr:hypothetical protein [Stylosanthes scabra]